MRSEARRPSRPWAVVRPSRGTARGTVFCFAHCGGSPAEYIRLAVEALGDDTDVDIVAVQPPGHGSRADEDAVGDFAALVEQIVDHVEFRPPFVLLGHSLGGLVAFEVARMLRRRGLPAPVHAIVSSALPPHRGTGLGDPAERSDDEVLTELADRCGPLPRELEDPDLRARSLAALRRDLRVAASHRFVLEAPLDTPVTVLVGRGEVGSDADGWQVHATRVERRRVPGDHFHVRQRPGPVFGLAREALAARATAPEPVLAAA